MATYVTLIHWTDQGIKQAKGLTFLRKGIGVPSGTITAQFNVSPENVRTGQRDEGQRRLSDWMAAAATIASPKRWSDLGSMGVLWRF